MTIERGPQLRIEDERAVLLVQEAMRLATFVIGWTVDSREWWVAITLIH